MFSSIRSFRRFLPLLLLLALLAPRQISAAEAWHTGDKVEILWSGRWYPGAVIETNAGKFKIHYDGFSAGWDEWVGPDRLRTPETKPAPAAPASATSPLKKGDRVEAWNAAAWYPATILEVGSGEHAGQMYVHYENFSAASNQWTLEKNIRALSGASAAKPAASSAMPRLGKYGVYTYGVPPNRIYVGDLELLPSGKYRVLGPGGAALGEGAYEFDAAAGKITWHSGPYQHDAMDGAFAVSREGKTHSITLRRGMVASNNSDN